MHVDTTDRKSNEKDEKGNQSDAIHLRKQTRNAFRPTANTPETPTNTQTQEQAQQKRLSVMQTDTFWEQIGHVWKMGGEFDMYRNKLQPRRELLPTNTEPRRKKTSRQTHQRRPEYPKCPYFGKRYGSRRTLLTRLKQFKNSNQMANRDMPDTKQCRKCDRCMGGPANLRGKYEHSRTGEV